MQYNILYEIIQIIIIIIIIVYYTEILFFNSWSLRRLFRRFVLN